MQKSEFPNMHHYVGFLQIGSPIAVAIVIEYHASYVTSSGKCLSQCPTCTYYGMIVVHCPVTR